jgi:hypothetical protein
MDINLIDNKEKKIELAKKVLEFVKDGQTIGFGSGSTSYLTGIEIGKLVKEKGIKITAVPTSSYMFELCKEYGIETAELHYKSIDWSFDGADEVDGNNNMIKGMGAAMFKEKLNILNSKKTYILIDNSKFVNFLGENHPIPVEVFPTSEEYVSEKLRELGAVDIAFRGSTENENSILDVRFDKIDESLEKKIKAITGVIESGLFIGYDVEIIHR